MGHFWGKYLATFYFNIWSHLVTSGHTWLVLT